MSRPRHLHARRANAGNALGDIAFPGAPGDVIVEPCVAIDENVYAGAMLGRHVAGQAVEMLLAIG